MTAKEYKEEDGSLMAFSKEDLENEKFLQIAVEGLFNSGSYVINVKKMREAYIFLTDQILTMLGY